MTKSEFMCIICKEDNVTFFIKENKTGTVLYNQVMKIGFIDYSCSS